MSADAYSQYAPPSGASSLVEELLHQYTPRVTPRSDDNPVSLKALVTDGAAQGVSLACTTLLETGDEVIMFSPAFDLYNGCVLAAGAVPIHIPLILSPGSSPSSSSSLPEALSSADIEIDFDALQRKLSPRTKILILNSPHNPTGKVFTRAELVRINDVLDTHAPQCVVVSDEVYEHLVLKDDSVGGDNTTVNNKQPSTVVQHIPFASVSPSASRRTLSVYSSGKTLSTTGLKVGWVLGPETLVKSLLLMHQYVVFSVCHAAQAAIAQALKHACQSSYYDELRATYQRKRDMLVDSLKRAGLIPIIPQGAFYVCAVVPKSHPALVETNKNGGCTPPQEFVDLVQKQAKTEGSPGAAINVDPDTWGRQDYNVCRFLAVRNGVTAIPTSAFLALDDDGGVRSGDGDGDGGSVLRQCVIRFAFCHPDEALAEAGERLCG